MFYFEPILTQKSPNFINDYKETFRFSISGKPEQCLFWSIPLFNKGLFLQKNVYCGSLPSTENSVLHSTTYGQKLSGEPTGLKGG